MKPSVRVIGLWGVLVFCLLSDTRSVLLPSGILDIEQKGRIKDCTDKADPGDVCTLNVEDIRPTQFAVGMQEVKCKTKRFEDMSKSDLAKYLEKNPLPTIIGPDERFYVTDHHHLARSLFDADIDKDQKVIYCQITFNWRHFDKDDDFWEQMMLMQKVWLYDERGMQPMAPEYLPSNVGEMLDDPFRSLSWMVRNRGGYEKTDGDFSEFLWGNFFRDNIPIPPPPRKSVQANNATSWDWCTVRPYSDTCLPKQNTWLQSVLGSAMTLAISPAAANLPGYGRGSVDPPNCGGNNIG